MTSRTKGTPSDTVVGSATRAKRSASRPSSAIKDASYLSQDPTAADDNNLHLEDDGDADSNTPPKKVAKTAKTPKTTNVKNTKAVAKQPAKKRTRRRSPEVASDDEVAADSLGGIQQQHHTAGDITPVLDEKSLLGDAVYPDGPSVLYAAGMYLARNEGAGSAEAAEPTSLPATQTTSTRSGPTAASYKRRATTAETEDAYEEMDESRDNDDHLTNSSLQPFTQEEIPEHMNYENNMPPAPPVPHGLVDEPQDLHEMAHHQHQYQHQHHDQQRHHEPEDLHPAHQHEPEDLHAMAHDEGGVVAGDAGRAPTRQSARRPATRSRFKPYDTKQTVAAAPAAPRSTSSSSTSRHTTAVAKLATRNNDQQMQDDVEGEMEMKRRRNTEAARRSRERKANRLSELEQKVEELEIQNTAMHNELSVVEKERTIFSLREAELNRRIHNLEQSLRDAHDALMARALGHMSVGHLQAVDGGAGGGAVAIVPGGGAQQLPAQPTPPQGMMAVPAVPTMAGGGVVVAAAGGGGGGGMGADAEGALPAPEDELVVESQ